MKRTYLAGMAGILLLVLVFSLPSAGPPTGEVTQKTGLTEEPPTQEPLTETEQGFLLTLARQTLEETLSGRDPPDMDENQLTPKLREVQGCFVTLNKPEGLRGCIGHILPQVPLYQCIMQNAVSAALYDRRFLPVSYDELGDIHIDISVLSVPERLEFSSPQDLLDRLRPGVDGVVLRYQGRSSTYLPQVWDQLPSKQDFLARLCVKQGSPADCWARPGLTVETYQTFVFEE